MKRALLSALLLSSIHLSGCAGAKSIATGLVAASDLAADKLANDWDAALDERIDECRAKNLETPEERKDCLGKLNPEETDKAIAAVKVLIAAQGAVKVAAECEELSSCAKETDWATLAAQVKEAWEAIRPYVQAMKEQQ